MAIVRGASTNGTGTTVTLPSHSDNDLLFVTIFGTSTLLDITDPTWTLLGEVRSTNYSVNIRVFSKRATSSSTSPPTGVTNSLGWSATAYSSNTGTVSAITRAGRISNVGSNYSIPTVSKLSNASWLYFPIYHQRTDTNIDSIGAGSNMSIIDTAIFSTGEMIVAEHANTATLPGEPIPLTGTSGDSAGIAIEISDDFFFTGPPQLVGSATGVNTATMPAHQAGDLILVYTFRDGSTTSPSGVSGYTDLAVAAGTSCSYRVAYRVATGSSHTVGTWSNATSLIVEVWRGVNTDISLISQAQYSTQFSGATQGTGTTITITPKNPLNLSGDRVVSAFIAHRSTNVAIDTVPTGFTLTTSVSDATDEAASFSLTGIGGARATTVNVGGTSSGWISFTVELIGQNLINNKMVVSKTLDNVTVLANDSIGYLADASLVISNIQSSSTSRVQIRASASNSLTGVTTSSTSRLALRANASNTTAGIGVVSTSTNPIRGTSTQTIGSISVQSDIILLVPKFANASLTLDGIGISSSSNIPIRGTGNNTLGATLTSSASRLALNAQSNNTLGNISISSSSIITIQGILTNTLSNIGISSDSGIQIRGDTDSQLDAITISSTSIITTIGVLESVVDVSMSSTSTISIDSNSTLILEAISSNSQSGVLIVAAASGLISAITTKSISYLNPYAYSESVVNGPTFQTSTSSNDWPYGFSTFTPSDDPYRS